MGIEKHYREPKQIIRGRGEIADTFIVGNYRFSPYMACEHGCLYCDGRAERYHVEGEFHRDIIIRKNLPEVMSREIQKIRVKGIISAGSGITDPYQPVDGDEKLMRKAAELIYKHRFPAAVLTKSSLALRDLDIWKKVSETAGFTLFVSLTFTNDTERQIFEPGASSVKERLEMLRKFKEAGCNVGVLAMPFLPGISDGEDNLRPLFQTLAEIPVDMIQPGGLTLRPGRQKDLFIQTISDIRPDLLPLYTRIYSLGLQSGSPLPSYSRELIAKSEKLLHPYHIPWLVPHSLYRNRIPLADEASVLMRHMMELYSAKHQDISRLKQASRRFDQWLKEEKKRFNRKRNLSPEHISEQLKTLATMGELDRIIRNNKLSRFLEQVILERKIFSYTELELEKRGNSMLNCSPEQ